MRKLVEDCSMVAYEFYWRDPVEGYQHIGTLPERRMNPARITEESVMNWAREILGDVIYQKAGQIQIDPLAEKD